MIGKHSYFYLQEVPILHMRRPERPVTPLAVDPCGEGLVQLMGVGQGRAVLDNKVSACSWLWHVWEESEGHFASTQ